MHGEHAMTHWIPKTTGTIFILLAVGFGSWLDPHTTIGTAPVSLLCIERLWRSGQRDETQR